MNDRQLRALDELHRELDLLVYRLEKAPPDDPAQLLLAWQQLRRRLEHLRESVDDLVRTP